MERLAHVEAVSRMAISKTAEFDMSFEGLGAFPNVRRPQVIWAGVSRGSDELSHLARRLKEDLTAAGFSQEERTWKAHMSLARCRPGMPLQGFSNFVKNNKDFSLGSFHVSSVQLMKSQLSSKGPSYKVLGVFPLQEG